jgi:23S rRNA (uracil1939-C5)-methyltransferase
VQIKIEKLVYGGAGMTRTEEEGVVFVGKVLPGELVEIEVVDKKKDYAHARLVKVLEPSDDRKVPECANFDTVGCCGWGHIDYQRQLEIKESIIREVLRRQGKIEWEQPIAKLTGPEREYRLRASFHITQTPAGDRLGFMEEGTHNVIPISSCAAFMPELNQFIGDAILALKERGLRGAETVRAVVSPDNGQVGATFHRGRQRTSWTEREPRTKVKGLEYRLRSDSFFQPNRFLLDEMMSEVVQACGKARTVLDLFCGSAFFSLPIARSGAKVTGIDRRSIANAIWNARRNQMDDIKFIKASAWGYLVKSAIKPDVVVLDPPRTGAGKNIVKRTAELNPKRVVYISCNPTTFAPEARILIDNGYKLTSLKFVDQFPNTPHIETISLFER